MCFFSSAIRSDVYANRIFNNSVGTVVEIIDGESIRVVLENGRDSLVKLIGVDSRGDDLAFKYLNNEYLGKRVVIIFEPSMMTSYYNRWNYAYVYVNGTCLNELLLTKGYAKLNIGHVNASKYFEFQENSAYAKREGFGVWTSQSYVEDISYKDFHININTASLDILEKYLLGTDYELAQNIIDYRNIKPFEDVNEFMYVEGMTNDIFLRNRFLITVKTDINKATYEELLSLDRIDEEEADEILEYRYRIPFTDTDELFENGLISRYKFDLIVDFIEV